MKSRIRQYLKKSKAAIVGYHVYENYRTGVRYRAGDNVTAVIPHGDFGGDLDANKHHATDSFDAYFSNSDLSVDALKGMRVLEVGPGDSFGVALKFLTKGAEQVICLDRFFCARDTGLERATYEALREDLTGEERRRFDDAIDLSGDITVNPDRIRYIHNLALEDAGTILAPSSFDLIVSMAVLEHVYDSDAAFAVMDRLLKPGGFMLHGVDFRDHGVFTSGGHHPLTFLTITDSIYKLMSSNTGLPNRNIINYYRHKTSELGYGSKITIARTIGNDEVLRPHREKLILGQEYSESTVAMINKIRPRLQPKYQTLSDEDLMVSAIFLTIRKPG